MKIERVKMTKLIPVFFGIIIFAFAVFFVGCADKKTIQPETEATEKVSPSETKVLAPSQEPILVEEIIPAVTNNDEGNNEDANLSHIKPNMTYLVLQPGQSEKAYYAQAEQADDAKYSSSDENVATVDENGLVTAHGTGTARLSFHAGDYTDSSAIWVTDKTPLKPLSAIPKSRFLRREGLLYNPNSKQQDTAIIMLTGDLMALSAQQNAASTGDTYDFNGSFEQVKPIFASADFVIGNLETCLSYSMPYTVQVKETQGNPNCNAQSTYLDALRYAGFDAVATANNHCGDAGIIGVYETIQMLDEYGIAHTGTFASENEPRFILADINGIRVGFMSYTDLLNSKYGDLTIPDDLKSILINRYSEENMRRDVLDLRDAGAEFIVAYIHWGVENSPNCTEQQIELAQQMADAGVDFIAGSHSHCVQPATIVKASDGRQVPCIYSMGNFVSSMPQEIHNDTVIVRIALKKDGTKTKLSSVDYFPCRVFPEYDGESHFIVPTSPQLNGGKSNPSLDATRRRVCEVIGSDAMRESEKLITT